MVEVADDPLPQRGEMKKIAKSKPVEHGLPFRPGVGGGEHNAEIAYRPTNSLWLNHIEAQFTALRYFTPDGTDHQTHAEQASMIRRYIAWRNRNTDNPRLRRIVERANVA
jgi:hypothetical protein